MTEEIARQAGQLRGIGQRRGLTGDQADMLIAATAHVHRVTLVTRNVDHFAESGVPLLNPFRG